MDAAKADAERLRAAAMRHGDGVKVLGPAVAPLARIQGRYRVQVLLKGKERAMLRDVMRVFRRAPPREVRHIVDVDPFSML
jgi:primosomal protein N' (replication factor Y)